MNVTEPVTNNNFFFGLEYYFSFSFLSFLLVFCELKQIFLFGASTIEALVSATVDGTACCGPLSRSADAVPRLSIPPSILWDILLWFTMLDEQLLQSDFEHA
jgi:hypothetical protein